LNGAPHSLGEAQGLRASRGGPIAYLRRRFGFNLDWITRPLFGLLLAGVAIAAAVQGGATFALFIAVGAIAGAREWHRMFADKDYLIPTAISALAIAGALASAVGIAGGRFADLAVALPFAVLAAGALLNLLAALLRGYSARAAAAGVIYLGVAALSLVLLRLSAPHALWLVLVLFAAVWATDTGALFLGNLIGGPKLAPVLSPNKTWAGFIGGIVCAGATAALMALGLRTAILPALGFGAFVAVAGHLGDLFESFAKRRAGRKNSGSLIPGHGGVLDRIDSTLFAAPAAAVLVLLAGFDPLAGLQP
jgi:phosphatidate cytidylyltransferase